MARFDIDAYVPPPAREQVLNEMALEGSRDPRVVAIARGIVDGLAARHTAAGKPPPTDREVFQELLDRLHDLMVYSPDPKDPVTGEQLEEFADIETLMFSGRFPDQVSPVTGKPKGDGDCEDMAEVFVALVRATGREAFVRWLDQPGLPQNHVAAAVCPSAQGGAMFAPGGCWWAEATLPGAAIGEDPYDALRRLGPAHRGRVLGIGPTAAAGTAPAGEPLPAQLWLSRRIGRDDPALPFAWAAGHEIDLLQGDCILKDGGQAPRVSTRQAGGNLRVNVYGLSFRGHRRATAWTARHGDVLGVLVQPDSVPAPDVATCRYDVRLDLELPRGVRRVEVWTREDVYGGPRSAPELADEILLRTGPAGEPRLVLALEMRPRVAPDLDPEAILRGECGRKRG
jgi:hypothetical protein